MVFEEEEEGYSDHDFPGKRCSVDPPSGGSPPPGTVTIRRTDLHQQLPLPCEEEELVFTKPKRSFFDTISRSKELPKKKTLVIKRKLKNLQKKVRKKSDDDEDSA